MLERTKKRRPVPSRSDLLRACDILLDMQVMAEGAKAPNRMGAMLEFVDGAATFAESVRAYLEETVLAEAIVARGRGADDDHPTHPPEASPPTEPVIAVDAEPADVGDTVRVEAPPPAGNPCPLCAGEGQALQERDGKMGVYVCPLCHGSRVANVVGAAPVAALPQ